MWFDTKSVAPQIYREKERNIFFLTSHLLWTAHPAEKVSDINANGHGADHLLLSWLFSGRRACAGEGLAKMELFLFFTGLLRRFVFQPAPGVDKSDLDLTADVGFTLTPMPHLVCAVPYE